MNEQGRPMTVADQETIPGFPFARSQTTMQLPAEYASIRASVPIHKVRLWNGRTAWILTRWEDVREAFSSPYLSSNPLNDLPSVSASRDAVVRVRKTFINLDPPEHGRYRRMLTREFMVKRINDLRPMIEELTHDLVDKMIARGGPVDFRAELAMPLPVGVISFMLGVPLALHETLGELSANRADLALPPEVILDSHRQLQEHLARIVREKMDARETPDDLLGRLVVDCVRPGDMTEEELVNIGVALYGAGHDTTASQLSLGLLNLLLNPDQLALLQAEPERVKDAVEEMLRFNSIAHLNSARVAVADFQLGGQLIRKGEGVFPLVAPANFDPEKFENPEQFDITRNASAHLAFGHGVHQCIGQILARLELRTVFEILLKRLPGLTLAVDPSELRFRSHGQVFRVDTLPVTW